MRKALWSLVTVCTVAQGALAATAERPQRIIPCAEIIDFTAFPYPGRRRVFGSVSVPPAYLPRSYPTDRRPWAYYAKQGMVVKRGVAVTITVPAAWRKRLAILWGNGGHGPFHTIRIAACRSSEPGHAYAGGFFLRRPSACAPLTFIVGNRRKTIWFGIGRRCG